ncbi:MAG: hypothetical protein HDR84_00120 [Bacteroides sp.]|nr:hypothetical protein [Bacteroides sp.]
MKESTPCMHMLHRRKRPGITLRILSHKQRKIRNERKKGEKEGRGKREGRKRKKGKGKRKEKRREEKEGTKHGAQPHATQPPKPGPS